MAASVLMAGLCAAQAQSLPLSGDPAADGWSRQGNSLAAGTYIRGDGDWSFDVYSHVFTIGAAAAAGNWLAGDTVLGLGAVTSGQDIHWPNLVAKFGAADATFSASTEPSPNGNGAGSFSQGKAGAGGVQVDINYEFDRFVAQGEPAGLQAGLAGVLRTADNVWYACGICPLNDDLGRAIALFSPDAGGRDILRSFEIVLNLSYLQRSGFDPVPVVGGTSNLAVQRFADEYTDALVVTQAGPGIAAVVPEADTYAMMLSGIAMLALVVARRSRKTD